MKIKFRYLASALSVAMLSTVIAQAADEDQDLAIQSKQAIADFQKADSTLQTFFNNSPGYAVFPSVGKGGFIVGAARGKGLVYETNKVIGRVIMTQGSIGAQIGGQSFAEIIFFENPAALNDFKAGRFEMSAEVSAVAAAEGVSRAVKYKRGVAVFTLPKTGLMVQASIGGQQFRFEPTASEPSSRSPDKKD